MLRKSCAWILILSMVLTSCAKYPHAPVPGGSETNQAISESDPLTSLVSRRAAELEMQLTEILKVYGSESIARYLRFRASEGLDLSPLRDFFIELNQGRPEVISIRVPPGSDEFIQFANQQLRESGVDFIEYEGIVDPNLQPREFPLPEHAELYQKWKTARLATVPFAGFAVTFLEAARGVPQPQLIASLVRAFTYLGLEAQFILFTAQWSKIWGQEQSLITWRFPEEAYFAGIAKQLNRFLDATEGVKLSHLYNYLVTWGVTLLLYTSDFLTLKRLSPEKMRFSLIGVIANSWVVTTGVFFAMGLTQVATSTAAERGEITEMMRFQFETLSGAWIAFWRIVSIVPNMRFLGRVMLYSFGAAISVPLLLKENGARSYAEETHSMFEQNAGRYGALSDTTAFLSGVYGAIPFSRDTTIVHLLYRLKERVDRYVEDSASLQN